MDHMHLIICVRRMTVEPTTILHGYVPCRPSFIQHWSLYRVLEISFLNCFFTLMTLTLQLLSPNVSVSGSALCFAFVY